MRRIGLLVTLALVLMLIASLPAGADPGTINVDDDAPGCVTGSGQSNPYSVVYCNIQDAVTDAAAGDTINVAPGVYEESAPGNNGVRVTTSVTIEGSGRATYDDAGNWIGGTLITRDKNAGGQALNSVVEIAADNVVMSDLTVDGRYGMDQVTEQTTNYGIFVTGQSVELSNLDVLDSTNHGVEFNNADNGVVTDVTIKRTAFAPAYYNPFDSGLRVVDTENILVDGLVVENAKRSVVVFQGIGSGTFKDVTINGSGVAESCGFGFYTETAPGWWDPAWGDYEGDLTFAFEGTHNVQNVDWGIYVNDELTNKDIALSMNAGSSISFSSLDIPLLRKGEGSVPDLDSVAQDMGLNARVSNFDPTNFPSGQAFFADFATAKTWGLGESADVAVFDITSGDWEVEPALKIQPAINAASAGDTINVAAGTYDSSSEPFPILINKSVTLLGAQANVDPRPSQGGRTGGESVIDADETSSAVIRISASDVEINGFTITGGTGDMVESGSADGLLFRYNILYDDLSTSGDEAIQIKYSNGVVMEYNYAYNILQDAFNLSKSTNGAIRYNEAHDIYSENAAIYCYGSTGLEIRGNLIYRVHNNDGIKLGSKDGSDAELTGGSILDNVVHDTAQDGISVYMSGVLVEGNEVYNSTSENGAIYVAHRVSNITIRGNTVHDNSLDPAKKWGGQAAGILIGSEVDASTVRVNFNSIYNNTPYGMTNKAAGVVDAKYNWSVSYTHLTLPTKA